MQIFILAEGLKIEFFLALSGRESSLVQTFCESCVHFDITHLSIHPHYSEICDSRLSYLKRLRNFLSKISLFFHKAYLAASLAYLAAFLAYLAAFLAYLAAFLASLHDHWWFWWNRCLQVCLYIHRSGVTRYIVLGYTYTHAFDLLLTQRKM